MISKKGAVNILAFLFRPQTLVVIALLAIIYFGFVYEGSFLIRYGDQILEPDKRTDNWNGYTVNTKAAVLGSVTASQQKQFCGADGQAAISNSIEISNNLIISSTSTGAGRECYGNYIESSIELPKGTLEVTCDISAVETYSGNSQGICEIYDGNQMIYFSKHFRGSDRQCTSDNNYCTKPGSISDKFYYNVTSPKNLKFVLTSGSGMSGTGTATMKVSFTKYEEPPITTTTDTTSTTDTPQQPQDLTPTKTDVEVSAKGKSILDMISNFVKNIIDSILGVFKK